MAKIVYPDFFNDVFGPIMQPGSSGGFAGPARIGNVARSLVEQPLEEARFLVDEGYGSLSELAVFMTDRGYLGGVQGFAPDDIRLFDAFEQARRSELRYSFAHAPADMLKAREVSVAVRSVSGETGRLVASSVGGGMIEVRSVNGFSLLWRGDTHGLIVSGASESLPQQTVEEFKEDWADVIVATQCLRRRPFATPEDDAVATLFELSEAPDIKLVRTFFPGTLVVVLPPQLPVVATKRRKPQLFTTVAEWHAYAEEHGISFPQAAIEYEQAFSGWDEERIRERFERIASLLRNQIHVLDEGRSHHVADTPMLPLYRRQWDAYREDTVPVNDGLITRIIEYALAVNAKVPGTLIVPGPMGTGGGYLFAALEAVKQRHGCSHARLIEALIVAAGLGALAYTHTVASGEVGCAGESGVCCAMASGAIVWLMGGTPQQVEGAASMALQGSIGLVCDPIPGGKEFPCLTRTVRAATSAPLYADLAMSGIDSLIPYHEMLQAIDLHYRASDPARICGSGCGCNLTETAQACKVWLDAHTEGMFASEAS